jgi:hypothetical protein
MPEVRDAHDKGLMFRKEKGGVNMPAGDGTGPMGMGPMTGRAMGYCSGYQAPGFANAGFGRGFAGRGFAGFGRGRGNRFWARTTGLPGWYRAGAGYPAFGRWPAQTQAVPVQQPAYPFGQPTKEQERQSLEQEKEVLKQEIDAIKQEMESIEKRIAELRKEK